MLDRRRDHVGPIIQESVDQRRFKIIVQGEGVFGITKGIKSIIHTMNGLAMCIKIICSHVHGNQLLNEMESMNRG